VKTDGARWFLQRRIGGGIPISASFGAVIVYFQFLVRMSMQQSSLNGSH
jgi:hypothetical protein